MKIPPAPVRTPFGSYTWADWYSKVTYLLNNSLLDHNGLQGLQGGGTSERYHLTSSEYAAVQNSTQAAYYTPIASNLVNSASSTVGSTFYQRIGNLVEVRGVLSIDRTVSGILLAVY